MRKLINELLFGKNAMFSGLIALSVVGLIVLGCSCGKDLDLGNLGKTSNSETANTGTNSHSRTSSDDPDKDNDSGVPSDSVTENLVKETTAEFADAVDSGDFTELYNNASSDFQSTYTVEQVEDAFKSYTDKKSVVVPVLRKVGSADADFSAPPSLRSEHGLSILMAKGKFATKPFGVRFDYEYVKRDGEWKLLKLVINIP